MMAEPNQEPATDKPDCDPAEVRVHVIYHGTVQGLGSDAEPSISLGKGCQRIRTKSAERDCRVDRRRAI